MSLSTATESTVPGQMPDYLLIGQMLDNPEKPPLVEEPEELDEVSNEGQSSEARGFRRPVGTSEYDGSIYNRPPEYRATYISSSPVSPMNSDPISLSSHPATRSESISGSESATPVSKLSLDKRFVVPTKNASLSSGFPYDPRVYDLISQDEWHLLSQDILNAAKLSVADDAAAWTAGVTTGTLATPLMLVFGPVAGYYAGRAVHRKTVLKAVKERLDRDGEIRAVLRRWNSTTFKDRGFEAWLELPVDGGEIKTHPPDQAKPSPRERRIAKKVAKRFKIVIIPTSGSKELEEMREPPSSIPSLVEAMGNELREPVELRHDRDPAELDYITPITNILSTEDEEKQGEEEEVEKVRKRGISRGKAPVVSTAEGEQRTGVVDPRSSAVELP